MIHLDDATITGLLDAVHVTDAVERAFAAWGRGEAATTQRVRAAASGQMASGMAAVVPPFSGGKLYATHAGAFTFVCALFDDRGALLCTLDGDALTRLRTPAISALAIRHLAAPAPKVGTVLGSGRQALPHLRMLRAELPAAELRVWGRDPARVASVAAAAASDGIDVRVISDVGDAVAGSDVVVTVTSSTTPLFDAGVISDRTLVCAAGATKYDRCEIPVGLVARCAAIVCDDVVGSRVECGDLLHAERAGTFVWDQAVELCEVVAGTRPVASAGAAPVLFETQGVAIADVAAAALAWQRWSDRDSDRT